MADPLTIHVNGEARIRTGTGTDGALETLGVSVDGVNIEFTMHSEDVIVDTFGPGVPFDVQYFLEQAFIHADMVWYAQDVLFSILGRTANTTAGNVPGIQGIMGSAGWLFVQNNKAWRTLVMSIPANTGLTDEPCWNFPTSWLHATDSANYGTRRTVHRMTFRAIPLLTSGTGGPSDGSVLCNGDCD
jgi:hypothetical protein